MADEVTTISQPIIIELGKAKKKKIKRLKRGRGVLMDEVHAVLNEVITDLGDEVKGKDLVPVIVVYEKKRKKRDDRIGLFPFV